ncbi:MAG: N-acetyl-alpha-D-glucosaminyl L-malate synthase BshA [Acidobacteria bacterium]|nr:N-acetyl-alpha-D-glucosaminyl L-malate synthase BshA [Acidobacteriota bacterium]
MKIGITCYPTYGGSGIVATELGMELAARGHEIHFISYANPIRLSTESPRIHYHEVEVSTYPLFQYPPYCLALASRMAEVAETAHLDLLHVHYAIPHAVSALLARQMLGDRLPFVTTLHGTDITLVGADRSYLPIVKFSIEQSDGVTSISQYLKDRTLRVFETRNEIRVIRNFVNCDQYHHNPDPQARAAYAAPQEKILVHLSNFRPVKRVADAVRVMARVRREIPCKLLMIGDGPDRGPAEHLARELGVEDDVLFLGKQSRIPELLAIADLMLLPSELEAFGLAALEAMACGVPTVATRAGGVPELITDGVDGLLAEVGDIEAMAAHALSLLTDPARYLQVSDAARHTAESRFCTTLVIPQYEEYYREVCSRSSTRRRNSGS